MIQLDAPCQPTQIDQVHWLQEERIHTDTIIQAQRELNFEPNGRNKQTIHCLQVKTQWMNEHLEEKCFAETLSSPPMTGSRGSNCFHLWQMDQLKTVTGKQVTCLFLQGNCLSKSKLLTNDTQIKMIYINARIQMKPFFDELFDDLHAAYRGPPSQDLAHRCFLKQTHLPLAIQWRRTTMWHNQVSAPKLAGRS